MRRSVHPEKARDVMTTRVEALSIKTSMADAVRLLLRRRHSGAPVVDDEHRLVGMISEHHLIEALSELIYEGAIEGDVAAHMTKKMVTARPDEDVFALASKFSKERVQRVVVVDERDRVMGLITGRDLVRALDAMVAKLEPHKRSDTYELIEIRHRELD